MANNQYSVEFIEQVIKETQDTNNVAFEPVDMRFHHVQFILELGKNVKLALYHLYLKLKKHSIKLWKSILKK